MLHWLQPFERWIVRIENIFGALAIATLLAAGALICTDVTLRYGFNRPILGGVEIVEYALVYITFLGASWAVPRGAHIDLDVVVQRLPRSWQRVCRLLCDLIAFGVAVALVIFGSSATWTAYIRGAFKPTVLQVPTWIVLVIIPIGSLLLTARFLRDTIVSAEALASGRDVPRGVHPPPSVE